MIFDLFLQNRRAAVLNRQQNHRQVVDGQNPIDQPMQFHIIFLIELRESFCPSFGLKYLPNLEGFLFLAYPRQ